VQKPPSENLARLIRELQDEIERYRPRSGLGSRSRADLHELARRRIEAPHEILDWAKRDRRWSFTLAEVMAEPGGRPHDLAARLVLAIVEELEQEREVLASDALAEGKQSSAMHAE
jgi:hypothetical protein